MFCLHVHLCGLCVQCPWKPEEVVGYPTRTGVNKQLPAAMWLLGIEFRSSGRVSRTLNCKLSLQLFETGFCYAILPAWPVIYYGANPCWPQTCGNPPASVFFMLVLQAHAKMNTYFFQSLFFSTLGIWIYDYSYLLLVDS